MKKFKYLLFKLIKLLVRRVNENFIMVLNYPSLTFLRVANSSDNILDSNNQRFFILRSPCSGPDSKIEVTDVFNYIAVVCFGQYNLYRSDNLNFIANARAYYNVTNK